MSKSILVINCGSSSIKFALFSEENEHLILSGIAENLLDESARIKLNAQGEKSEIHLGNAGHEPALARLIELLDPYLDSITAVGHRVVHGGEHFQESSVITPKVIRNIEACIPLAPLHNPVNLLGIRTLLGLLPGLLQVAVFDTAFHQKMPEHAYLYALPYSLYRDKGVRRYGFHGTSHYYVTSEAARRMQKPYDNSTWISAHLGNGCSLAAVQNGFSIDTSMGMTPLEGIVMGTRSGDIDPGILIYLEKECGMAFEDTLSMLNKESGLLGLSELSHDCRTIEDQAEAGHEGAKRALDVFCYRLAKGIGAYAVALKSVDGLIFTGGIGEHSPIIRAKVIEQLGILGFELDTLFNARNGDGQGIISRGNGPAALVVPTNEELVIARDTQRLTS